MHSGLRRSAADIRYVVATIGLSLMLTLPAVTAAQLWRTVAVTGTVSASESARSTSQLPAAPATRTTPPVGSPALSSVSAPNVTAHRAVTSAIIGPRTPDHLHSQLAAADTVLSADVLDAIDAIVAPGVDLAAHEKNDTPPALLDAALRRR